MDMLRMIGSGLFVVFFFGFCVFIHELGHFLVAKWRGLHVIAFSIGFKKVWGYKYKGVEYRIGCLPLGGYVDLPQIDTTSDPVTEDGKPLPPAKPIDRILTAFAGPLFNILFGLLLGCLIWWQGIPQGSPEMSKIEVAYVTEGSPEYNAGLRKGDVITAINGEPFYGSWLKIQRTFIFSYDGITLDILRNGEVKTIKYRPKPNKNNPTGAALPFPFFAPKIPVVLHPKPNSVAAQAGIQPGDKVLKLNGYEVLSAGAFMQGMLSFAPEKRQLLIERDGKELTINLVTEPIKDASGNPKTRPMLGVVLNALDKIVVGEIEKGSDAEKYGFQKGDEIISVNRKKYVDRNRFEMDLKGNKIKGELDILIRRGDKNIHLKSFVNVVKSDKKEAPKNSNANAFNLPIEFHGYIVLTNIIKGGSAEQAGLKKGDKVIAVNGNSDIIDFSRIIKKNKYNPLTLSIQRGKKVFSVTLTPKAQTIYGAGLSIAYINHPTPINQFITVCTMTWKSVQGIFYNVVGNKLKLSDKKSSIGAQHLSGPLGIVERIYASVYYGSLIQGLFFIVIITFSLGLFNLLPIPVLDGGHIVFATLEIIMGRKLPNSIMKPIIVVCIVGLLSLMVYATFNDVKRTAGVKDKFFIKLAPAPIENKATVDAETAATKKKPTKNDANKTN